MHVRWVCPESHLKGALAVDDILRSGNFTRSVAGRRLEAHAGRLVGRPCVAVNSGTSAIWASLQALKGIRPGTVLIPAFGFPAAARMAAMLGMPIMIADVAPDVPVISADAVAEVLDETVSVIVIIDYFDMVVDSRRIRAAARFRDVAILEDSAGSFLACDGGVQACAEGDISVVSLHASKIVTAGEGGLIFADSADLYSRLSRIRANGLAETVWYQVTEQLGMNLTMPELSAALAMASFETVNERLESRRRVRAAYADRLADLALSGLADRMRADVEDKSRFGPVSLGVDHRDFVLRTLRLGGIEARACWGYLASEDPVVAPMIKKTGDLTISRRWRDRVLNLPVHEGMSESMIDYTVSLLERALRSAGSP